MKAKTAIVIGATGLVGSSLLKQLCESIYYEKVLVFHRRALDFKHAKLEVEIVDFDGIDSWKNLVKGDVLFSAMGTTIKVAGSKENQYKVDYTYQYLVAKAAVENGTKQMVLVSSAGANAKSSVFYLRMKGELENALVKLSFKTIHFIRPNLLVGDRKESRAGEIWGEKILVFFNSIGILKSQKPIHVDKVAKTMITSSLEEEQVVFVCEGADLMKKHLFTN